MCRLNPDCDFPDDIEFGNRFEIGMFLTCTNCGETANLTRYEAIYNGGSVDADHTWHMASIIKPIRFCIKCGMPKETLMILCPCVQEKSGDKTGS